MVKKRFIFLLLVLGICILSLPACSYEKTKNINSKKNTIQQNVSKKLDFTYINNELGFSITIPYSWKGKYSIKKTQDNKGIYIIHKGLTDKNESIVTIFKMEDKKWNEYLKRNEEGPILEKIGYYKNYIFLISEATEIPYDINIEKEKKDALEFEKMYKDIPYIIKSFKIITTNSNKADSKLYNKNNELNTKSHKYFDEGANAKSDTFYIEEIINTYEVLLIEAINSNNFSIIEKYLVKNSDLYNAQKNLVNTLYKKGIKEKLINYNIYDIKLSSNGIAKVYVSETIEIKNSENKVITKQFNWIYTVISKETSVGISDITKWEKN